jgi:hypothetical protein
MADRYDHPVSVDIPDLEAKPGDIKRPDCEESDIGLRAFFNALTNEDRYLGIINIRLDLILPGYMAKPFRIWSEPRVVVCIRKDFIDIDAVCAEDCIVHMHDVVNRIPAFTVAAVFLRRRGLCIKAVGCADHADFVGKIIPVLSVGVEGFADMPNNELAVYALNGYPELVPVCVRSTWGVLERSLPEALRLIDSVHIHSGFGRTQARIIR